MHHPRHDEAKRLENALRAAHNESLLSLHASVGLLKSSASEAMAFIEAGNMLQAAALIATLYYDCDEVQKRIIIIADKG